MATEATRGRVDERYVRPLFLATIVTGSFLLFLTQPMIARMALPRVGGAPAVWNSAMLVYQLLLLGGYAYAHWLAKMRPLRQVGIHIILLAVASLWLPIGLAGLIRSILEGMGTPAAWLPIDLRLASAAPEANPFFLVPWLLLSSIGPLFFIVSAQAPLMQRWYALETSRGDPYPLYAASNLGSFAGLITYPLLVEPLMTLQQQSVLWMSVYAALVLLVVGCAFTVPAHAAAALPEETAPPPTTRQVLHWIVLAAVPSGLMLSTTTHLTTDIVAMPMLWALPLGLYLLSFVVAFAHRRGPADIITMVAPLAILIAGGLAFSGGTQNPFFSATAGLVLLFAVAVALHTALFRLRPPVGHLTRFYLAMSFGGMLGGLFVAIAAPILFDWVYEHPLLILAAAVVVPQYVLVPWPERWQRLLAIAIPAVTLLASWYSSTRHFFELVDYSNGAKMVVTIAISLLALACLGRRLAFAFALAALMLSYDGWSVIARSIEGGRTRSYFGVYEVSQRYEGTARVLTHGTTLHGIQNLTPGLETMPTSYYARRSGVGLALESADILFGRPARVGVVGLGSGTLSCYAKPGQAWTFFEIDPAMVRVARDRFTFLSECAPQVRIVLGDARLSLQRQPAGSLDVLAVDAFSSDAVPMHLLTREALEVYGRAVQRDGIVLFHISNRYLNLEPVIAELVAGSPWTARELVYVPSAEEEVMNATVSVWIALSRNPATIDRLVDLSGEDSENWLVLDRKPGFRGWTDDYGSILPILNVGSLLPW